MSITIEHLPDEPIVIMKFEGSVTAAEVTKELQAVAEQIAEIPGTIYRIYDISDLEMSIREIITLVNRLRRQIPGVYNDPGFEIVFVNDSRTSQMYADILRTQVFREQPIRIFGGTAEAVEYVRKRQNETA